MAKATKIEAVTEVVTPAHIKLEVSQRELDIIVAFLGQGRRLSESHPIYQALSPLSTGSVRVVGDHDTRSIPTIDIKG